MLVVSVFCLDKNPTDFPHEEHLDLFYSPLPQLTSFASVPHSWEEGTKEGSEQGREKKAEAAVRQQL